MHDGNTEPRSNKERPPAGDPVGVRPARGWNRVRASPMTRDVVAQVVAGLVVVGLLALLAWLLQYLGMIG